MPKNSKLNENNLPENNARLLYLLRWRRFERWWAVLLLGSLFLLLFYQGWLYFGQTQTLSWLNLPAANWYGADYDDVLPTTAASGAGELWGSVTLELQNYTELHRATVLVNGREAGSFSSSRLTLRVFDGDLLEIDCTAYARPVRFQLLKTSVGIDRAMLQTELELCGQRGEVGQIKFK